MIGQNEQHEHHYLIQQDTERRQTNQDPQYRKLQRWATKTSPKLLSRNGMSLHRSPVILFWGKFIHNLPWVFPTIFLIIWPNGLRENKLYLANNKQELPMSATIVIQLARNMEMLYKISHTSFKKSNNWLCLIFSEEICFYFSQSETRIAHGDCICFLKNFTLSSKAVSEDNIFLRN